MVKKRVIFTLLYYDGYFCLSRNFNLQKIGNLDWLNNNYNFAKISAFIDELIIIDVTRNDRNIRKLCRVVKSLTKNCFIPITVGGGIDNLQKVNLLMNSGSDKVILNSAIELNPKLIELISKNYGSQSIVASVDLKLIHNKYFVYIKNGEIQLSVKPFDYFNKITNMPVGEIYINSINRDGTGQGYFMDILKIIPNKNKLPIILAGGAGTYKHLAEGLKNKFVDAVATANLLNFIGDGLKNARKKLLQDGYNLAIW